MALISAESLIYGGIGLFHLKSIYSTVVSRQNSWVFFFGALVGNNIVLEEIYVTIYSFGIIVFRKDKQK